MILTEKIVIVGAGIVGASIAWHLARAGAAVTVIEAGTPGSGATQDSWSWINASWGNPEPYFRLRHRAMEEWRRLEKEIDLRVALQWNGGLIWDLPRNELEAFAAHHASWGYGIRHVGRDEVMRIEPGLLDPPDFALHVAAEGAVEPVLATLSLLASAQDLGAELVNGARVRALDMHDGRVAGVVTGSGVIEADTVVVAAGTETAPLVLSAGLVLPVTSPPGLLVYTRRHGPLLNGLVMSPALHVRQALNGALIAGGDFGGSDPGEDAQAVAADLFEKVKQMFVDGASLVFDHHRVGYRPLPGDGFPIVGGTAGVPGLYVAVTHSGVTLAPAIGRFAAEEIATGRRDPLLLPYGVDRFAAASG